MYESPIEKTITDIQSQIIKQDVEHLMYSVNQSVGYNVDKGELLKALQYDRKQYQKGYADAMGIIKDIRLEIHKLSPILKAEDIVDGNPVKDAIWETLIEVDKIIERHISGKE